MQRGANIGAKKRCKKGGRADLGKAGCQHCGSVYFTLMGKSYPQAERAFDRVKMYIDSRQKLKRKYRKMPLDRATGEEEGCRPTTGGRDRLCGPACLIISHSTTAPSTKTFNSPCRNWVQVSSVVSGWVTMTATRSLEVVTSEKSTEMSWSDRCAEANGCWRMM